jgi:hypothetical protein
MAIIAKHKVSEDGTYGKVSLHSKWRVLYDEFVRRSWRWRRTVRNDRRHLQQLLDKYNAEAVGKPHTDPTAKQLHDMLEVSLEAHERAGLYAEVGTLRWRTMILFGPHIVDELFRDLGVELSNNAIKELSNPELHRVVALLRHRVREERWRRVKAACDTLVPVLSLIVAILGLLIAFGAK